MASFADHDLGANLYKNIGTPKSIPSLKTKIVYNLQYNHDTFTCTIYPNPHRHKIGIQQELIKLFGNRIQKGQHCLGITEDTVKNYIENKNYTAFIYIKNNDIDDSATCSLQYYNWYNNKIPPQLWIHDICRVNNTDRRDTISPVRVLFDVIKQFSDNYQVTENYLLVEKDKPATDKLLEIYGNYGFKIADSSKIEHTITMKRSLPPINRKRTQNNRNKQNNQPINQQTKRQRVGGNKRKRTLKRKIN